MDILIRQINCARFPTTCEVPELHLLSKPLRNDKGQLVTIRSKRGAAIAAHESGNVQ